MPNTTQHRTNRSISLSDQNSLFRPETFHIAWEDDPMPLPSSVLCSHYFLRPDSCRLNHPPAYAITEKVEQVPVLDCFVNLFTWIP